MYLRFWFRCKLELSKSHAFPIQATITASSSSLLHGIFKAIVKGQSYQSVFWNQIFYILLTNIFSSSCKFSRFPFFSHSLFVFVMSFGNLPKIHNSLKGECRWNFEPAVLLWCRAQNQNGHCILDSSATLPNFQNQYNFWRFSSILSI